jgi:hypothetical protein
MMVFEKQSSNHIDQTQSKNNHSVLIVQKIFKDIRKVKAMD